MPPPRSSPYPLHEPRLPAWKYDVSAPCDAENLGDPAPGAVKACFIADEQPPLKAHPANAMKCADEEAACKTLGRAVGERLHYYLHFGAGEAWVKIDPASGATRCAPASFGGDPAPGAKKACFIAKD